MLAYDTTRSWGLLSMTRFCPMDHSGKGPQASSDNREVYEGHQAARQLVAPRTHPPVLVEPPDAVLDLGAAAIDRRSSRRRPLSMNAIFRSWRTAVATSITHCCKPIIKATRSSRTHCRLRGTTTPISTYMPPISRSSGRTRLACYQRAVAEPVVLLR